MPSWTAEEAAALTLGLSPQTVGRLPDVNHPLIDRFHILRKIISRAFAANDTGSGEYGIVPADYLTWAKLNEFDVPTELAAEVARVQTLTPKRSSDKPLGTRERDTHLKIILGMAMGGYAYNPTASKSPTVREICDDFDRLGLNLDQETIRRKLKEAAALFGDEVSQAN